MSFDRIRGHERPVRVLIRTLASGRIPHSYLFWGSEGIGKELVAREVARVLLCCDPKSLERARACGSCGACRKLGTGNHPDLHLLVASGSSISVADIRSLQETLSYQAFERGRKVAIIRDAFRMTREAANALLKTLEEPPAGTHIFLLVHHRNQLLPTLVSRCQSVRFDPIAEDEVRRLLEDRGVEPRVAEWMAEVSGGCPGAVCGEDPEAFEAAESELVDVWERWEQWSVADRFSVASRWATEKDRIGTRLEGLERIARRRVRQAAAQGEADDRALDVLEALYRVRRLMDQNVNTQLALDALFQGLAGRDWEEFS